MRGVEHSEEDCIEALKKAVDMVGLPLKHSEFNSLDGFPSASTVTRRAGGGSWTEAKRNAGLRARPYTKEDCIEALREVTEELSHSPSMPEYKDSGVVPSAAVIQRNFSSWNNAKEEAGLERYLSNQDIFHSREECLSELRRVAGMKGGDFSRLDFDSVADISYTYIEKEFGSWNQSKKEAGFETWEEPPSGSEHPRWKEDKHLQYGPNWLEQREKVIQRDGEECKVDGCDVTRDEHREKYGMDIHVHHIVGREEFRKGNGDFDYETANVSSNLVTLCLPHHRKYEGSTWSSWRLLE